MVVTLGLTRPEPLDRVAERLAGNDAALIARFRSVRDFARRIRVTEYHLTNACNIRCKGCWFFEYGFDKNSKEVRELPQLAEFIARERERRINTALLIGGEPTLFLDRIKLFVDHMKYVTISTNGLKPLPMADFENVALFVTLFGGGPVDDELRAIRPNGTPFTGLFDTALRNYHNDPRVTFIYALTSRGIRHIRDTVRRIEENGNKVNFNFYSEYGTDHPLRNEDERRLLDEAMAVLEAYPHTVIAHPYYLKTIATGKTDFGSFGYDVCPSISADHPAHKERLANGKPSLAFFNTYSADLKTINFCCTSGHCDGCRDSQAVSSWLLVSARDFLSSRAGLETWVDVAEAYWRQFIWSPYRTSGPSPTASMSSGSNAHAVPEVYASEHAQE